MPPKADLKETKPLLQLDADLLKFLASALGFGFFLLGYSYTHSFFRSFGLSIFDINIQWLDIIFRGIALLENTNVWVACLLLAVGLSFLWEVRAYFGGLIGALMSFLIVIVLVYGALAGGKSLGIENAKAVWGNGAGKKTWCRLTDEAQESQPAFAKTLYDLALAERLRLLHINQRYVYLAPVLEVIPKGQEVGESYAVKKEHIVYCRVVGSQSVTGDEIGV